MEFICSACLYVQPRPGLSEDEKAEMSMLTVINGHMVCVRHAGVAGGRDHNSVLKGAVFIESGKENMSLSEYQDSFREAG